MKVTVLGLRASFIPRPLCALCQGLPHPGMDCAAYKASPEDAPLLQMAATEMWRQCPGCRCAYLVL